jgi:hypothetical protein
MATPPLGATMPIPMFVYPAVPVAVPQVSFIPTYPPVEKPTPGNMGDEIEDVRNDSIAVAGLRQTMWWRQDEFRHLIFKFAPITDMPGWRAFIDYAQQGGSFLYYPDSTLPDFDEWWLEDSTGSNRSQTSNSSSSTNWAPKFAFRTMAQHELVMRKVPGGLHFP